MTGELKIFVWCGARFRAEVTRGAFDEPLHVTGWHDTEEAAVSAAVCWVRLLILLFAVAAISNEG